MNIDLSLQRAPIPLGPDDVVVLSLGAGVQSSALLLACDKGDLPWRPAFAVFADTQDEPQTVYDWLWRLTERVTIPIYVSSKGRLSAQWTMGGGTRCSIPFYTAPEDGAIKSGILPRQCTNVFKLQAIQTEIRRILGYRYRQRWRHRVHTLIGISTDEASRAKPARDHFETKHFPLLDAKWSRDWCIEYLSWFKLGSPPRSACVFCPFRSDTEWRHLKDHDPEAWQRAIALDNAIRDPVLNARRGLRGGLFCHRSLTPLQDLSLADPDPMTEHQFVNECEGDLRRLISSSDV